MIVKDIATFKEYVPTIETAPFAKLKPHVITAEEDLQNDLLGSQLFEKIASDAKLKTLCERYVCLRAYERAIPFLDLKQTEQGFAVIDTEGFMPASKERVKALVDAARVDGDKAEESLLSWLEDLKSDSELKAAWVASAACTYLTDTYISTLKEYVRYAENHIPSTRREFARLRGAMRSAIQFKLVSVVSAELNAELLEQLRTSELNEANIDIIESLRFAMAAFVSKDPDKGDEYLRQALGMLKADPDKYPKWKNSAVGRAELGRTEKKNDGAIFFGGF